MTITVGSLCSGIGGLELALASTGVDFELKWVAENDDKPSEVLRHRLPGIPNVGDWTNADLEPVDLLVGGLPCQPVSHAGLRKGVQDERFLFDDLATVVGRMEPTPSVFLENVRGILSASGGEAIRRVIYGLAGVGLVGRYGLLRASDVGAPHRRERWFCLATPDAGSMGRSEGTRPSESEPPRLGRSGSRDDGGTAAPDADGKGSQGHGRPLAGEDKGELPTTAGDLQSVFGRFSPAIARWERVLGRSAPSPQDNKRRLNPPFVEWAMGYPEGWVTDLDLSRAAQLKALGNAVVPLQAATAWQLLTEGQ